MYTFNVKLILSFFQSAISEFLEFLRSNSLINSALDVETLLKILILGFSVKKYICVSRERGNAILNHVLGLKNQK